MKPNASKTVTTQKPHRGGGEVRIIGGQWRRTRLAVPDKPGLRPTPDRVRETLFNWLGQDLQGWQCLDAFAGTGVLGLEAASRGAVKVLMCEQEALLVAQIKENAQRLQAGMIHVQRGDGVALLAQQPASHWDLVFLDPPYAANLFEDALRAAGRCVKPQGWIYLEAPHAWEDATLSEYGLRVYRYLKAGAVHAHLLSRIA